MKKVVKPCLRCGKPVEFGYVEKGDVDERGIPFEDDELGWWGSQCEHCGQEYDCEFVEARMNGKLFGFVVGLDDEDHIRNWLRILLTECPEAQEIAREVLRKR